MSTRTVASRALDALLVINALNSPTRGRGALDVPRAASQLSQHYLDTSGDNQLSAIDALLVINALNARRPTGSGEGESVVTSAPSVAKPLTPAKAPPLSTPHGTKRF